MKRGSISSGEDDDDDNYANDDKTLAFQTGNILPTFNACLNRKEGGGSTKRI